MEGSERVCPRCGSVAGRDEYCETCGLHLWEEDELPTQAQWASSDAVEAPNEDGSSAVGSPQQAAGPAERAEASDRERVLAENPSRHTQGAPTGTGPRVTEGKTAGRIGPWMARTSLTQRVLAGIFALVIVGGAVAAWQVKSINIPLLSDGSASPSSSSDQGPTASAANDAEEELRAKLAGCADEWNRDGLRFAVDPTEASVLVTTNSAGDCVVAFDEFSSGGDGSVGAYAWVRGEEGEWGTFIDSETPNLDRQITQAEAWELERAAQGNATVTSAETPVVQIAFNAKAPLPANASASPTLVLSPERQACDLTVDYTGGSIGDFSIHVTEATGIRCEEAKRLAATIPPPSDYVCKGEEQVVCEKGDFGYVFEVSMEGESSDAGAGGTTGEEELDCGGPVPGTVFDSMEVSGISCEDGFSIAQELAKDPPLPWHCESEAGYFVCVNSETGARIVF